MINSTDVYAAELLLQDADFPSNFIDMHHPDDYKIIYNPFVEYIPHFNGHHNRLIIRICWKVSDSEYMPMSFVCDTGAPMGFYLCNEAIALLKRYRRIIEDETGTEYAYIHDVGKAAVEPTPPSHAPGNIIGLRVLIKLRLSLNADGTFVLNNIPDAF